MAIYHFEAVTYAGTVKSGDIEGENIKAVRHSLLMQELVPVEIILTNQLAIKNQRKWHQTLFDEKALSRQELSMLTKQLSILVRSGIQIDAALSVLSDETNQNHVKKVLSSVISGIRSGLPFSKAIAAEPLSFDYLYQGVISAAEHSGNMALILADLSDFLEKRQQLKQKALGALIYPAALTGVAFMIVIFLMIYVVPQISKVFESSRQVLPFSTQLVMNISELLLHWGWLIALVFVMIGIVAKWLIAKKDIRFKLDQKLLKIPMLGRLILSFETSRFAGTMAMLISANVPILLALNSASNTLKNTVLITAINNSSIQIQEGLSLSKSLDSQGVFSPILIHLIRSGEASGNLGEMLKHASDNAELESEQKARIFTGLIEPILILVMGLMVLLIVMAVMQPILEMNAGVR
jgi:general secretion pathway protein F